MDNIDKFVQLVQESDNIVFFGGAGISTESGFLISEVQMDYIIKIQISTGNNYQSFLLSEVSRGILQIL